VALTAATAGLVVEVEEEGGEEEDDEVFGRVVEVEVEVEVAANGAAAFSLVDESAFAFATVAVASPDDFKLGMDAIRPVPAGGSAALALPERARALNATSSERRFDPERELAVSIGRVSLSSFSLAERALDLTAKARRPPADDTGTLSRLVAGARLAIRILFSMGKRESEKASWGESVVEGDDGSR